MPSAAQASPTKSSSCAGHDLEQRRLARAVQADDADLGAGEERQRDVLQDLLAPRIGLGELVHVIDVLGVRHRAAPRVADELGLARLVARGAPSPQVECGTLAITWDSRMPMSPRAAKLGLVAGVLAGLMPAGPDAGANSRQPQQEIAAYAGLHAARRQGRCRRDRPPGESRRQSQRARRPWPHAADGGGVPARCGRGPHADRGRRRPQCPGAARPTTSSPSPRFSTTWRC